MNEKEMKRPNYALQARLLEVAIGLMVMIVSFAMGAIGFALTASFGFAAVVSAIVLVLMGILVASQML